MIFQRYFNFLIILVLSILIFSACDDDDSNPAKSEGSADQLIGKWTLIEVVIPAFSMELTPEEAEFMVSGEVKSDGTFSMTNTDSTVTITETGEWNTSGSTLIMTYEDGREDELEYSISGNEITVTSLIEMQGMELMAELTFRKE